MDYKHFKVKKASTRIGAYISEVNFNEVEDKEVYKELRKAVNDFSVVFVRKQPLTPEAFVRLGREFGTLESSHPVFGSPAEHPEIQLITYDPAAPVPAETGTWHTDNTYNAIPSAYTFLRAVDIPPSGGGDTLWASNAAIYEDLPEPMQEMLSRFVAHHDLFWRLREMNYMASKSTSEDEQKLSKRVADHPIVIRHPVTGRAQVFAHRHFTNFVHGVPEEVSTTLLQYLFNMAKRPDYQVRLTWEPDMLTIWDNIATQHYATQDYHPYPRAMMRMVVAGSSRPQPLDSTKLYPSSAAELVAA